VSAGRLAAVTGANGFLGSHVCDVLAERGWRARAGHRAGSDVRWLAGGAATPVIMDLQDAASLDALFDGCDGVVHCAGALVADEDVYRRVNVNGTRAVAEAAARAGVRRLVYVSSLAAGGPAGPDAPRNESHPDQPISGYGRSKLAAEHVLRDGAWPFETLCLRPPALYGPRDREFLPMFRAARLGWTARFGTRLNGLSMVHGRDAATAAVTLLEHPAATGVYYVDDGPGHVGPTDPGRLCTSGYRWNELRRTLAAIFQRQVRELLVPLAGLRLAGMMLSAHRRRTSTLLNPDRVDDLDTDGWVCDASRLRRDTGWQPEFDLVTGLRDTVTFMRLQGWLR
jgi:nucleoside-diphosphate-sugar epimerase